MGQRDRELLAPIEHLQEQVLRRRDAIASETGELLLHGVHVDLGGQLQPGRQTRGCRGCVLQREDHLEERRVAGLPVAPQVLHQQAEGQLLVAEGAGTHATHPPQEIAEGGIT